MVKTCSCRRRSFFRKKGINIVAVNRQSFVDAVLKSKSVESMGFDRKDYDRIVSIK